MTDEAGARGAAGQDNGPRLFIPSLSPFYEGGEPLAYALLRAVFGLTIVTHGVPKLMGVPHGSMTNPMRGSIDLIEKVLNLPFAPQLAAFVAALETFGGLAVAARWR
jgi:putative oxidoreductase